MVKLICRVSAARKTAVEWQIRVGRWTFKFLRPTSHNRIFACRDKFRFSPWVFCLVVLVHFLSGNTIMRMCWTASLLCSSLTVCMIKSYESTVGRRQRLINKCECQQRRKCKHHSWLTAIYLMTSAVLLDWVDIICSLFPFFLLPGFLDKNDLKLIRVCLKSLTHSGQAVFWFLFFLKKAALQKSYRKLNVSSKHLFSSSL